MSQARSRVRDDRNFLSGTYYNRIGSPQNGVSLSPRYSGNWGSCDDVVGNREGVNPLEINTKFAITPVLNGKQFVLVGGVPTLNKAFTNYPIDLEVSPVVNPVNRFSTFTSTQRNAMTWSALAKSNPSAPTVSVPTFLAELKDIPGLLKDLKGIPNDLRRLWKAFALVPAAIRNWGDDLLRQVARGHITWRWAIRPMLSDLNKMLDFCASVDKTLRKLDQLAKTGSLRTRVNLGHESISEPPATAFLQTNLDTWKANRTTKTTRDTWFCCRWTTTGFTRIPTNYQERIALARRLTYGITSYEALATLWEILPWSWFVDWFVGVGTVIQACNNTLSLSPIGSCIMSLTQSVTSWNITQRGSWSIISGVPLATWTIKERWSSSPSLPLAPTLAPVVDASKWSILASLYVLNRGRRMRRKVEPLYKG
jgi:hypothetical protein